MWQKRSEMLAPLTDLVRECGETKSNKKNNTKKKPWRWESIHQQAFDNVKATIAKARLVIPVFKNLFFGPKKPFLTGFLRISFFPAFSGGIFHMNVVLEGVAEIPVFGRVHRNFLQEFLRDRNSCIYSGFLRIPPDFAGFLFPPNAVWLRPADKSSPN